MCKADVEGAGIGQGRRYHLKDKDKDEDTRNYYLRCSRIDV